MSKDTNDKSKGSSDEELFVFSVKDKPKLENMLYLG